MKKGITSCGTECKGSSCDNYNNCTLDKKK